MVERYNEKWKSIFGGVLGGKEWTHDCVETAVSDGLLIKRRERLNGARVAFEQMRTSRRYANATTPSR